MLPASCRQLQASSLRSPESNSAHRTSFDRKVPDGNVLNMKMYFRGMTVLTFVALAIVLAGSARAEKPKANLKITSTAFQDGGDIPERFTRDGRDAPRNINPPLRISGVPLEAKSLVLIVDDPDAPGGVFTHWLVWNIDPKTTEVPEHSAPRGATWGVNDFGGDSYDGPQPPSGTHRYYFKIFALDQTLNLRAGAKRKELDAAMKGHVIAQAELMGRYSKK
jgi:Raf kinase inhibitor-like YbhB/YbcL family protein